MTPLRVYADFDALDSNALALELITSQHAQTGTLITFAQFLLIAIFGLRRQLTLTPLTVNRGAAFRITGSRIIGARSALRSTRPLNVAISSDVDEKELGSFSEGLYDSIGRSSPSLTIQTNTSNGTASNESSINFHFTNNDNIKASKATSYDYIIFLKKPSTKFEPDELYLNKSSTVILDDTDVSKPIALYPPAVTLLGKVLHLRFKQRTIPLKRYLIHVVLFLLVNLLNNVAFAYHIPMAVHIIFRSGGLVTNMIMGYLIEKRRYSKLQVFSVFLVTFGVALTTLSSMNSKPSRPKSSVSTSSTNMSELGTHSYLTYSAGISILTLALIFSGALGLLQDRAFITYGRGNWEEAMFYLHALALPMFGFVGSDLMAQIREVNAGPKIEVGLQSITSSIFPSSIEGAQLPPLPFLQVKSPTLLVPAFYIPLLMNIATQLVCVSGVNRLTSQVNSLTVALVLVVRKAVSLAISILLLGRSQGNFYLWIGAVAVLLGTIGYTIGNGGNKKKEKAQ